MFCSCSSVKNRDESVKENEYKVSGLPMKVSLGILMTVNASGVISASLLSVVMLIKRWPSLYFATKNTSCANKSLLILKATFGSSVVRCLRSKVLFVWFAETESTAFTKLSKAFKILDDDACSICADPSSSLVELFKSWSTTVRMLFSTWVNVKKIVETNHWNVFSKQKRTARKFQKNSVIHPYI